MPAITYDSRSFNRHPSEAKKAAFENYVVVTNHGKKTHLLLGIDDSEYDELVDIIDTFRAKKIKVNNSIVDLISMDEGAECDFQPERIGDEFIRDVDFL